MVTLNINIQQYSNKRGLIQGATIHRNKIRELFKKPTSVSIYSAYYFGRLATAGDQTALKRPRLRFEMWRCVVPCGLTDPRWGRAVHLSFPSRRACDGVMERWSHTLGRKSVVFTPRVMPLSGYPLPTTPLVDESLGGVHAAKLGRLNNPPSPTTPPNKHTSLCTCRSGCMKQHLCNYFPLYIHLPSSFHFFSGCCALLFSISIVDEGGGCFL